MTRERYVVVCKITEDKHTPKAVYLTKAQRAALKTDLSYGVEPTRRAFVAVVAVDPASITSPPSWATVEAARMNALGDPTGTLLPRLVRAWQPVLAGKTRRSAHRRVLEEARQLAHSHNLDPSPTDPVLLSRVATALLPWVPNQTDALLAAQAAMGAGRAFLEHDQK